MKFALTQGAYQARSVAANAQRCINLFPELNPEDAPFPVTHYPCPGLKLLATSPNNLKYRCLYRTKSTGELFAVCGAAVYQISSSYVFTLLGSIVSTTGYVSMCDNGFNIVIVDGSAAGYTVDLTTKAFATITDVNFYGGTRVDTSDTYYVTNRPGTNNWYISLTNQSVWNPLDIASKTSMPDKLQTVLVLNDNIVTIGALTTEIWFNTGASDFTYQKVQGVFIEHGTVSAASVAKYESSAFWLSQNEQGQAIVLRMGGLQVQRVSNHAIEDIIRKYAVISDAVGLAYQIAGHVFYQLTFPTADATWVWDDSTKLWHQRDALDASGVSHRHNAQVSAFAFGLNLCGDYANGNLYQLDLGTYSDNGTAIRYLRSWPVMEDEGKLLTYRNFTADMESGNAGAPLNPQISLRWSDDRGATFGNPVLMPLGSAGAYDASLRWWGLGVGRYRVFELSWSDAIQTALNGAWVDIVEHRA